MTLQLLILVIGNGPILTNYAFDDYVHKFALLGHIFPPLSYTLLDSRIIGRSVSSEACQGFEPIILDFMEV